MNANHAQTMRAAVTTKTIRQQIISPLVFVL